MQAQGSLRDTNLASLLQTMQSERATGTLSLDDSEQCALYFLFGHLFHASGAGGQGEEVVIKALGWTNGSFRFDPRAKLPAEETIKSPPSDLISRAESRQREAAAAARPEPAPSPMTATPAPEPVPVPSAQPAPYPERPAPVEPRWGRPAADAPATAGQPAAAPSPRTPRAEPAPAYASAPASVPAYTAPRESVPAPQPMPGAVQPQPAVPVPWSPRAAGPSTPIGSPAAVESRDADEQQSLGGAPDAQPLDSLYPLPAGKKQYEGLKSAFVDFPKLLRTLKSDRHTGYVRLNDGRYSGSLLLHDGDLLEALSSNGGIAEGEPAFLQFRRHMDEGSGLIDVIELAPDTVVALAQLLTARPLFTGLLGRFIDFNALLEYLAEEKVDGSVVVAGGRETGVILLRNGGVLGAYTGTARQLDTKTNLVAALAKERPARIEVKSGAADVARMDFEASLNQPY